MGEVRTILERVFSIWLKFGLLGVCVFYAFCVDVLGVVDGKGDWLKLTEATEIRAEERIIWPNNFFFQIENLSEIRSRTELEFSENRGRERSYAQSRRRK